MMSEFIRCKPQPVITGTCELCGRHNQQLKVLTISDFIGWACGQCIDQIGRSVPRRYVSSGEQTEPTE